ncbi:MAG: hypothetical protein R3C55_10325 [Parvularculaceae bacterium]
MRIFLAMAALAAMQLFGAAMADETQTGASVKIDGARGGVFAAGANVEITGEVSSGLRPMTGVLALGGSVRVSATIDGSLVAAGGDVTFTGEANEFIGSGGNVTFAGSVEEDAMIAGGNLTVTPDAFIGGTLRMAGGALDVSGKMQDGAEIAGASIIFNGEVTGDLTIDADDIVIGPDAKISGELIYYSPKDADISPQAILAGGVVKKQTREGRYKFEERGPKFFTEKSMTARAYGALFWFVALGASGALMMLLFPRWMGETAASGRERPLTDMLIGVGVLIAMPIAAIVFMVIILGIPFGAFMLALYLGLLMVSNIGAGLAVGHLLMDKSGDKQAKFLPFLAGLAIVLILGAVPYIGALFSAVGMTIGLGALFNGLWVALRTPAESVAA